MKTNKALKAVYIGETETKSFFIYFQTQLLTALKVRGIITDKELEKGIRMLKETVR